jgi:hypothetical protein
LRHLFGCGCLWVPIELLPPLSLFLVIFDYRRRHSGLLLRVLLLFGRLTPFSFHQSTAAKHLPEQLQLPLLLLRRLLRQGDSLTYGCSGRKSVFVVALGKGIVLLWVVLTELESTVRNVTMVFIVIVGAFAVFLCIVTSLGSLTSRKRLRARNSS